jgi:hypothetical protein
MQRIPDPPVVVPLLPLPEKQQPDEEPLELLDDDPLEEDVLEEVAPEVELLEEEPDVVVPEAPVLEEPALVPLGFVNAIPLVVDPVGVDSIP